MRQLKVRFGRREDAAKIIQWINGNPANHFDKDILEYPTLRTVCSYDESGVVGFLPFHQVLMLESTAWSPESSRFDRAQAGRDFTKAAELMASSLGIREIYFLGGESGMGQMAVNGHGYEELTLKVFRMKLK